VQFTDQSDPGTLTWLWDFGDTVTSTEQNPTHTYTYPGWFTVSLTVTDSLGSDTKTEEHYIKANLVVREQKYNYIFVTPTLKTYDIAPPENRLDLRIATMRGNARSSILENGISVHMPESGTVFISGFKRPQGPTLIFD
jgi:PKD repeat protein